MNDKIAKQIFKEIAGKNMVYYNEDAFKNTHNTLYRTILLSIKEAYRIGEEKNKEALDTLNELVQVKEWKEKYGKDAQYLKAQPIAWSNAEKVLKKSKS